MQISRLQRAAFDNSTRTTVYARRNCRRPGNVLWSSCNTVFLRAVWLHVCTEFMIFALVAYQRCMHVLGDLSGWASTDTEDKSWPGAT